MVLAVGCGGGDEQPPADGGPRAPIDKSPMMHNFGSVAVGGQSAAQVFTFRNNGSSTLSPVSATIGGANPTEFAITTNGCTSPLARSANCMVTIVFRPAAAGARSAFIEIKAGQGKEWVNLSGTGIQPALLTITPPSKDFGAVPVGSASEAQVFTITNGGGADATAFTVAATGDFSLGATTCGATLAVGASCTQAVTFVPKAGGPAAGVLTASAAGSNDGQAALSGMGVSMPTLVAMPSSIDFGAAFIGETPSQTITVTNPNPTAVTMFSAQSGSNNFAVGASTCAATIPGNGTCMVTVAFAPTEVGDLKGVIALSFEGGSTGVPVQGVGRRPATLVFSPPTHDFGSVPAGTMSGAVTLQLTNIGQQEASMVAVTLGGADAAEFSAGSCSATLPAGGSCNISVRYNPADVGASTATLTATGMPGGTATAGLNGTGTAPPGLQIDPSSQEFGTVIVGNSSSPVNFAITNIGAAATGPLTVATLGADYSIVGGTDACSGQTLGAGQNCTLSVRFSPTTAGTRTSTLTVSGNPGGSRSAQLTGTGVVGARLAIAPPSHSFGSVGVGAMSNEVSFTVTNTGDSVTGMVGITPSPASFQVSTNGCLNQTLDPGESCTVGVRFIPSAVADVTGSLTATASPGGSAVSSLTATGTTPSTLSFQDGGGTTLNSQAFATTNVGAASAAVTVFLRNTGMVATGMLTPAIGGTGMADFEIVAGSNTCTVLLPGGVCSMQLRFVPKAGGLRNATVNVTAAAGGVASLAVSGTGRALIEISEDPGVTAISEYDYGDVSVGATLVKTFKLNAYATTGTITLAVNPASPANFALINDTCTGSVQMGTAGAVDDCTFDVRFQPQAPEGDKAATLNVTTSTGLTAAVSLAGTAAGPLTFSPTAHAFGTLPAGSAPVEHDFTLTNNGAVAMTSVAVTLSGDSDFTVAANTCATAPPAGGNTCTVTVRFVAGTAGAKAATVTAVGTYVAGGMNLTDEASFGVTGTAGASAMLAVTPNPKDFGSLAVGAAGATQVFTVTNAAGLPMSGPVTIGAPTHADYAVSANTCLLADNVTPKPLAAGESCTFTVTFTPTDVGSRSGTILVSATPGGSVSVVLSGVGLATLSINPAVKNFDDGGALNVIGQTNQTVSFAVTNSGTAMVTLTPSLEPSSAVGYIAGSEAYYGIFAVTTPCGATLAAGATCNYGVRMVTPGGPTAGVKKAVLKVTGGSGPTTATAELTGTMRTDAALAFTDGAAREFGGVLVGTTSGTHLAQITNTGGVASGAFQAPVLPTGFTNTQPTGTNATTGNAICAAGSSLAPNQTCDILIAFSPTGPGAAGGNLSVTITGFGSASSPLLKALSGTGIAAGGISAAPSPQNFGSAAQNAAAPVQRMIAVTNDTGGAITLNAAAISAGAANGYSIGADGCAGALNPGSACMITVNFQPGAVAPGPAAGTLTVTQNGGAALTVNAALFGIVRRPPTLVIEPPVEGSNWGEALVGVASAPRTFTIRNTGEDPTTVAPTVATTAPFSIPAGAANNTCTAVLAPNGTCAVNVILTPAAIGAAAANLTATAGATMDTEALSGNGVLPSVIQIVSIAGTAGPSTTVNFGNRAVLSETPIVVEIKNADNAQLIPAPTFTLTDGTNYRVDTDATAVTGCADVIAANSGLPGGTTCSFTVFFRPQSLPASSVAAPNLASTMTVGGANTNLTLTLNGHAVSSLSSAPTAGAFGNVAVNATSATVNFVITNSADTGTPTTGQLTVALSGAAASDYIVVSDSCTGMTVASTATCTVGLALRPSATGTRAATMTVTGSSTNGVSVELSGTGI